ncbi:hypothetical protein [Desulfosediminicola flagellatus]|uniref:hypothetical protein n=1 Tax=Desulfosediminicola flagellatus TaxID=2569541 RepID=UPI0010ABC833|nr:hypothetical protein [Desulfosediminicola flagellatus]
MINYLGNSAYCFSNSLKICLENAGMENIPNVGLIEALTGMPFGATFLDLQNPVFFPSPSKIDPEKGLSLAMESLGWSCTTEQIEEEANAKKSLVNAVKAGPVLVGPIDMGGLSYDPNRSIKQGGDHFVVVTNINNGWVELHDPQLFPCAILPINDFLDTWNAKEISYSTHPYTLRFDFRKFLDLSLDETIANHLHTVRHLMKHEEIGGIVYCGSEAFLKVAELINGTTNRDFTNTLVNFCFPLGARRCIDGSNYFSKAKNDNAAVLMEQKAKLFGNAQYYAVQENWESLVRVMNELALLEPEIAQII